jgi:hypothetical protein
MTTAALQYAKFRTDVAAHARVYTFLADGELLVFPIDGREVVPFWSSRSRLDRIVATHAKYGKYAPTQLSLAEFDEWLVQLDAEGILVGVNWAGPRLTGYNVSVVELRAALAAR